MESGFEAVETDGCVDGIGVYLFYSADGTGFYLAAQSRRVQRETE